MGAWEVILDVAVFVVAGALFVVMAWAAIERGRVHRMLEGDHQVSEEAEALLARGSIGAGAASRPAVRSTVTAPSIPDVPKGDLR